LAGTVVGLSGYSAAPPFYPEGLDGCCSDRASQAWYAGATAGLTVALHCIWLLASMALTPCVGVVAGDAYQLPM
jgi:hypothetical protein